LQFESLSLEDRGKEQKLVKKFCAKSEHFLRRNARLLDRIRSHYRLGLVSNFYGNVAIICEEAGLSRSLDVIVDSARIKSSKPNPKIFLIALATLDLPPEQVVFVGDSYERDMIPARELGMKTLWLKGPNPRIPEHPGPVDDWISSLTSLEALM
jgi:putative hydrolase of the HAD superfamily